MSNAEELEALDREFREKLYTDALFSARVKLARNVLQELENMGRMGRIAHMDHDYAAYIVVAALQKAIPFEPLAEAWDQGMLSAKLQAEGIRRNATNPYRKDETDE